MKKIKITKLLVIFSCLLVASTGLAAQKGVVLFISGDVAVEQGGKWQKARAQMLLSEKDRVRTGKKGLAIVRLRDGATIKLKADSQVILSQLSSGILVDVENGAVFSRIQKLGEGQSYRIRAQTFVAAVRGTEFFFSYGAKHESTREYWLCVNEGLVSVSETVTRSGAEVTAGKGVHVPAGKKVSKPRPYEWTKKLNWNMNPAAGQVDDRVDISDAYREMLRSTYD